MHLKMTFSYGSRKLRDKNRYLGMSRTGQKLIGPIYSAFSHRTLSEKQCKTLFLFLGCSVLWTSCYWISESDMQNSILKNQSNACVDADTMRNLYPWRCAWRTSISVNFRFEWMNAKANAVCCRNLIRNGTCSAKRASIKGVQKPEIHFTERNN